MKWNPLRFLSIVVFATVPLVAQSTPAITAAGIVNAASYASGVISPGEIITIFGSNLGPATLQLQQATSAGFGASLATVQVLIGGMPAPLIYVSAQSISAIVPYGVSGMSQATIVVTYLGVSSNSVIVPVVPTQLGLFSADSSGVGPGAMLDANYRPVTSANPVAPGAVVQMFGTGEGVSTSNLQAGSVVPNPPPALAAKITATVGGMPATVLYAGGSPGLVAGLLQVNVAVPAGLVSCAAGGAPVVITAGGQSSQASLTIPVQKSASCPANLVFNNATINGNLTVPGLGTYDATIGIKSNLDGTYTMTLLALLPVNGLSLLFPSSTIAGTVVQGNAPNTQVSVYGSKPVQTATFNLTLMPQTPIGGVTFVTATGMVTATSAVGTVTGTFTTSGAFDGFIQ